MDGEERPTPAECAAWSRDLRGQIAALRTYRSRVFPTPALHAAALVFETQTSIKRRFVVAPTVHLGRPCGNPDCCPPTKV